jgi:hypothetical protein
MSSIHLPATSPEIATLPATPSAAGRFLLPAGIAAWGIAAFAASAMGLTADLARASAPAYGLVIATTITIPMALYLAWSRLQRALDAISIRALTLFQIPRIAGGVVFLAFGWAGLLPPLFALLVGVGDVIAGLVAAAALRGDVSPSALRRIHLTGLADFAIGLGTGMTLGLIGDPRLVPIAQLPLSQIVLWWVGMLATAHVVVLARLARGVRS